MSSPAMAPEIAPATAKSWVADFEAWHAREIAKPLANRALAIDSLPSIREYFRLCEEFGLKSKFRKEP